MKFEHQFELNRLTRPADRSEFLKPAYVVDAFANKSWNQITFPAAILQPPFYDPKADPAVNYGAIGAVIGHEVSHLFDDQGRKFDQDGRLATWWTDEDAANFKKATDRLVAQFDKYELLPGQHVNGSLTLGENIADVAGLVVALDAYHNSLKGKPAPVIDGYTGDQRFFLGYGQVWRSKYRDEQLSTTLKSDFHSPSFIRPWTTRNLDAWYAAFAIQPGGKMYLAPADRVSPW